MWKAKTQSNFTYSHAGGEVGHIDGVNVGQQSQPRCLLLRRAAVVLLVVKRQPFQILCVRLGLLPRRQLKGLLRPCIEGSSGNSKGLGFRV